MRRHLIPRSSRPSRLPAVSAPWIETECLSAKGQSGTHACTMPSSNPNQLYALAVLPFISGGRKTVTRPSMMQARENTCRRCYNYKARERLSSHAGLASRVLVVLLPPVRGVAGALIKLLRDWTFDWFVAETTCTAPANAYMLKTLQKCTEESARRTCARGRCT
jgi:hypothetical protein